MCSIDAVEGVRAAVDRLAGLPVPVGVGADLGGELIVLRGVIDRLEGVWAARLGVFDAAGMAGGESGGVGSTAGWVRVHCRMGGAEAAGRVGVARVLRDRLERVGAAVVAGEVGYRAAVVVAGGVADVDPGVVGDVEPVLVEAARTLDPGRLRTVVARLRQAVDPDRVAVQAGRDQERRRLHLSTTFGGLVVLDGLFDAEAGAVLRAALDPLTRPAGPGDRRRPAQRRADGLVELARRALDTPAVAPPGTPARPHLQVHVDLPTLLGWPGAPGGWLSDGTVLPPQAIRRIGCDATLTRIHTTHPTGTHPAVPGRTGGGQPNGTGTGSGATRWTATLTRLLLDPPSQPLDVGRTTRIIPPALRTALTVRDRGCVYPGCDRPPAWTDAHHLTHWADGGPTNLDNLALLCRAHHRHLHDHHQHLTRHPDGTWTTHPDSHPDNHHPAQDTRGP